jgi:hypothetical protein
VASGLELRPGPTWNEDLQVSVLEFSDDGKSLALIGSRFDNTRQELEGIVQIWGLGSGKDRELLAIHAGDESPGPVAFAPDRRSFAVSVGNETHVRDTRTNKELRRFTHSRWVFTIDDSSRGTPDAIAFSPDNRLLAGITWLPPVTFAGPARAGIRLWEQATGKKRTEFVFSPDYPDRDYVEIDSRLTSVRDPEPYALQFTRNSKHLLLGAGATIYFVDWATRKEVRRFGGSRIYGRSAILSPDGTHALAGTHDGRICIWDAATGTFIRATPGHRGTVTRLAFSSDGKTLVSVSADSTALVWDVPTLLSQQNTTAGSRLPAARLQKEFELLGDAKGEKAFAAMQTLAETGSDAVALLGNALQPVTIKVAPDEVDRLIENLGSDDFATRNAATTSLEQLEWSADKQLRQALASPKPTLEIRRRIERLLERLQAPVTAPDQLRALRGIEVLERIGTPDAKQVLERLAGGSPGLTLTREAKAALARLK